MRKGFVNSTIFSLERRHLQADLILAHRIFEGEVELSPSDFLTDWAGPKLSEPTLLQDGTCGSTQASVVDWAVTGVEGSGMLKEKPPAMSRFPMMNQFWLVRRQTVLRSLCRVWRVRNLLSCLTSRWALVLFQYAITKVASTGLTWSWCNAYLRQTRMTLEVCLAKLRVNESSKVKTD